MMAYNESYFLYIIQRLKEFQIHNPFDRAFQAENQRRGYVNELNLDDGLPVFNPIFSSFYENTIHPSFNNDSPESYISTASSSDYNFSDKRSSLSQAYFPKEACDESICFPNLQDNHSIKELYPNNISNHTQASQNGANLQTRDSDSSSSIESKEKRKRGRPIKEKYKNVPMRELNELKRKDNKEAALKYRQRVREERNEVKKLKEENSMLTVENSKLREELEQLKKSIAHSSSMVFTI